MPLLDAAEKGLSFASSLPLIVAADTVLSFASSLPLLDAAETCLFFVSSLPLLDAAETGLTSESSLLLLLAADTNTGCNCMSLLFSLIPISAPVVGSFPDEAEIGLSIPCCLIRAASADLDNAFSWILSSWVLDLDKDLSIISSCFPSIFSEDSGDVATRQGGSEDESSKVSMLSNSKESIFSSIDFNWVSSFSLPGCLSKTFENGLSPSDSKYGIFSFTEFFAIISLKLFLLSVLSILKARFGMSLAWSVRSLMTESLMPLDSSSVSWRILTSPLTTS